VSSYPLAIIDNDAPPPLAPLKDIIISPANIAAEARRQRAQTLGWKKRRTVTKAVRELTRQLNRQGYPQLLKQFREVKPQMETLYSRYAEIKEGLAQTPDNPELLENLKSLQTELLPIKREWDSLKTRIMPLRSLAKERSELQRALDDDRIARERIQVERQLMKAIVKEAQIYERLIIHKWTALGFAYRRDEGGKYKVDTVKFSEVSITLDAIYYKVDASFKTALGNWQTNVPQGVYVGKQLLNEETLVELSITCQRQVTGTWNHNGAWVIVHRLDSVDGLMNYVPFGDTLSRYPVKYHEKFPICVGVGSARKVQWVNLSDFPHWLIGGFTNSGKSNIVNVGICTLITKHTPQNLRLVLIDLKGGLEFNFYADIPHLHGGIVDSIEGVANTLAQLEAIMQSRFRKFRGLAKRIEEYHDKRPGDYMPRILCVFDEVASIMDHGDLTKQILASLRELTRMGRAVGIHIWLCTQRPDVKAVDGQIKNNLAVRLSGRMSSSADSMTIVGNSSAKDLAPIPGRMILQLGPDPTAVQTPHITNEDIQEALSNAKAFNPPPELDIPEYQRITHQIWTVEKVVELSIKHLGGNINARPIWDAADDLSQGQARELVEKVWAMPMIDFEGKRYKVESFKGKQKRLVEVIDSLIS